MRLLHLLSLAALAVVPAGAGPVPAAPVPAPPPAGPAIRLVPHRAVYDLSLLSTRGVRGIEGARGRIAFDFTGNACDGYGLKFRQVTAIQGGEGEETVSDLRTTSFESGDGSAYRFRNDTTMSGAARAVVDGSAERRAGGPLAVRLTSPKRSQLTLDGEAVFPNVQMRDLIVAARAGRHLVPMKLFDGSDNGRKIFETLAVIGGPITSQAAESLEAPVRQPGLVNVARWPVVLSYFPPGRKDQTPSYILSFDLYENGISRALKLDYGDFVLRGDLVRLDLLPVRPVCQR